MIHNDKIYNQIIIDDPLIQELYNSKTLQRLKSVNQYGASVYRFAHLTTTRFEHSLGVYFLLKKFNANLEEQAAGLLHDVPHTAFSHVIDFVFGGPENASFHEEFHEFFLHDSDAVQILAKHGIDWHDIYKTHLYKLLDRDLPDLCMDRLDYFFRDMFTDNSMTLKEINKILKDITRFNNYLAFENQTTAKFAAKKFREGDDRLWSNPLQATLYYMFAEIIKIALFDDVISFRDLFSTDEAVYKKLASTKHVNIKRRLKQITSLQVKEDVNNYDYHIKTKIRVIDPYVVQKDKLVRLSVLDPIFHKENQDYMARKREGFYVKII
ncbi:MAG: HD domain-containing protein [Patescibacteria group bacterium]